MNIGMFPSWLIEERLLQFQSDCDGGFRDPHAAAAAQERPDSDIYSYWVDDFMNRGMEAFRVRDYTSAAGFFKTVLDLQTKRYGESDPECCQTYLRYGLALLYETPFRGCDNLFTDLPLEADYLLCSNPTFVDASNHIKGVSAEVNKELNAEKNEQRESLIQKQLRKAWNIAGAQHNHTLEKLNTICALGEAGFRLGTPTSHIYYEYALCMMKDLIEDGLIETTDLRRAHIYFKICLSLQNQYPWQVKAIQYCEFAINVCELRINKIEELETCCNQKEMDVKLTAKFCNLFEKKLKILQISLILRKEKNIQVEI